MEFKVGEKIKCILDFHESLPLKGRIFEIIDVGYNYFVYSDGKEGGIIRFQDFDIYFRKYPLTYTVDIVLEDMENHRNISFRGSHAYALNRELLSPYFNKKVKLTIEEIE